MSKYAEILELDIENLEMLGNIYYGYGQILARKEENSNLPYIASCFTIAGIFKAILNQEESTKCFEKASNYFKQQDNNYWIICSLCASNLNPNMNNQTRSDGEDFEELENLYFNNYLNLESESNSKSYGRLHIPQNLYSEALREIKRLNNDKFKENSFSNFSRLFNRSSEFVYNLKADSYHWNSLLGNFLPIEPETIAFSKILLNNLIQKDISLDQIFERAEINNISRVPLEIAREMSN